MEIRIDYSQIPKSWKPEILIHEEATTTTEQFQNGGFSTFRPKNVLIINV